MEGDVKNKKHTRRKRLFFVDKVREKEEYIIGGCLIDDLMKYERRESARIVTFHEICVPEVNELLDKISKIIEARKEVRVLLDN